LPYDFIVGLPTIRKHKLAKVFDSLFEEVEGVSELFAQEEELPMEDTQADTEDMISKALSHVISSTQSTVKKNFSISKTITTI
jgi:hypothetical protein